MNERSPLIMTLFLRTVIMTHQKKSFPSLHVNQELVLLRYTSDLLKAYTGIMDYMSIPYPFPLMNMNRTIVIFYIFTLPFVLVNDINQMEYCVFMIFFITYGILGLELICVELDDPFGEDPNDFDVKSIAMVSSSLLFDMVYTLIMIFLIFMFAYCIVTLLPEHVQRYYCVD